MSRAVRRPTRFDDDLEVFGAGGLLLVQGSDDFASESLIASEVGYRIQPATAISLDATAFVHQIRRSAQPGGAAQRAAAADVGNTLEGQSHGIELGINVQPVTWWRTHVGYTWLDTSIRRSAGSRDVSGGVNEGNDPDHLFGLRSSLDLPRNLEFDVVLRAVATCPIPRCPRMRR